MSDAPRQGTLSLDRKGVKVTATNGDEQPVKPVKGMRRTRRARLRISRVDPWSVMKMSLLFSFSLGIISIVAVNVLWLVISLSGMLEAMNQMVTSVLTSPSDQSPIDLSDYITGNKVLGFTFIVSAINVLVITALGTISAFLYNLAANIFGGLEMTLAED